MAYNKNLGKKNKKRDFYRLRCQFTNICVNLCQILWFLHQAPITVCPSFLLGRVWAVDTTATAARRARNALLGGHRVAIPKYNPLLPAFASKM